MTVCARASATLRRWSDDPATGSGKLSHVTGVIFGAICALWLIYLVPWFLSHRSQAPIDGDPMPTTFTRSSMTIVRSGESLAEAEPGQATVPTPLTRRAATREVRRLARRAAARRRRILLVLLVLLTTAVVLAAFGRIAWMWLLAPGAMLLAFFILSPISVKLLKRHSDRVLAEIEQCQDEETIAVAVVEISPDSDSASVSLTAPTSMTGSLWDPIPVTAPTYMSQPLAPRTVRTIDLSSPLAPPKYDVPVPTEPPASDTDTDRGALGA